MEGGGLLEASVMHSATESDLFRDLDFWISFHHLDLYVYNM